MMICVELAVLALATEVYLIQRAVIERFLCNMQLCKDTYYVSSGVASL